MGLNPTGNPFQVPKVQEENEKKDLFNNMVLNSQCQSSHGDMKNLGSRSSGMFNFPSTETATVAPRRGVEDKRISFDSRLKCLDDI